MKTFPYSFVWQGSPPAFFHYQSSEKLKQFDYCEEYAIMPILDKSKRKNNFPNFLKTTSQSWEMWYNRDTQKKERKRK